MALGRIVVDVGIVRKQFKIDSTKNSPNYIEIFFTILKYQNIGSNKSSCCCWTNDHLIAN